MGEARSRQLSQGVIERHAVSNLDERVALIAQMVHEGREDAGVRELAVGLVSQRCGDSFCVRENDDMAEVEAVFSGLKNYYRYVSDPHGKDMFQSPARTLQFGGGDCDDATILVASCLGAIGFPVGARVVQTSGHDTWNHIYGLVGTPKGNARRWVPLDLSVRESTVGWEPPRHMIVAQRDYVFTVD